GRWGHLRCFPSGLGAALVLVGRTDPFARAERIPTRDVSSVQGGAGPPFRNPPSFWGHWGHLRCIPSGLGATLVLVGRTDPFARVEGIPARDVSSLRGRGVLDRVGAAGGGHGRCA